MYGYGVKGFTLSMIETAIEVTNGKVDADTIYRILSFAKDQLSHPVELLPGVAEVIDALAGRYRLLLITKGDLFDQESKIARSGLAERFDAIEVVAEKEPDVYRRVLRRNGIDARRVPDDRQLGAFGRLAGARRRRSGRARAVPPHVGAGARRTAAEPRRLLGARRHQPGPGARRRPRPRSARQRKDTMNPYEEAEVAAAAIAELTGVARHDVAVVLGSGWGEAAAELGEVVWEGPLTEVPGVPRPTVGGHKGRLVSVDADGRAVLVFAGRSHLYEGHGAHTVVHAVRAAVLGGCSVVVLTNAAGGLDPGCSRRHARPAPRPPQPHRRVADGR